MGRLLSGKVLFRLRRVGGVLLFVALSAACSSRPEMPGERIFEYTCGQCHSIDHPLSKHKNLEGWRRTVAAMRARGAKLTDEEAEEVAQYLYTIRPRK